MRKAFETGSTDLMLYYLFISNHDMNTPISFFLSFFLSLFFFYLHGVFLQGLQPLPTTHPAVFVDGAVIFDSCAGNRV
jgi:hypothetical protein